MNSEIIDKLKGPRDIDELKKEILENHYKNKKNDIFKHLRKDSQSFIKDLNILTEEHKSLVTLPNVNSKNNLKSKSKQNSSSQNSNNSKLITISNVNCNPSSNISNTFNSENTIKKEVSNFEIYQR